MYVYHAFTPLGVRLVARTVGLDLGPHSWVVGGLAAGATVGIASLSWHLYERPINDLKRRFDVRLRAAPGATLAGLGPTDEPADRTVQRASAGATRQSG